MLEVHPNSAVKCKIACIKEQVSTKGYALARAAEFSLTGPLQRAFDDIRLSSRFLPADPYCKEESRFRRYGKKIALPWRNSYDPAASEWDNTCGEYMLDYVQPASLNSEERGNNRRFPAFGPELYSNAFIQEIIRFDLANVPFSETEMASPIQVGLHLIRLYARPSCPAVVTPNKVHRDGEHFTYAHLIERFDVEGGENYVVDPEWADHDLKDVPSSAIRSRFTLLDPLDSYVVKDDLVAHHVEGVHVRPGAAEGWRTILLVDFTPYKPVLMLKAAA